MSSQNVFSAQSPWVFKCPDITKYFNSKNIFILDGRKMLTIDDLFDEFSKVLQFPDYFGRNYNALSDCLRDLMWIEDQTGFLILIKNGNLVLSYENHDDLEALIRILNRAGEDWATPVDLGEWWDRPAVAFNTVFEAGNPSKNTIIQSLTSSV